MPSGVRGSSACAPSAPSAEASSSCASGSSDGEGEGKGDAPSIRQRNPSRAALPGGVSIRTVNRSTGSSPTRTIAPLVNQGSSRTS